MNRSIQNALKAVAVLVCITVVCVGLLAVCNMFFPKYVPTLDAKTSELINGICATGVSDDEAFSDGYIVMLGEEEYGVTLSDYNKAHKSAKAQILAVYGEPKGEMAGAYIVECSSQGNDGDVVLLVAFKDGTIVGATAKKHIDSYWGKIPTELFDSLKGQSGDIKLDAVSGATHTRDAILRASDLSADFALEYNSSIRSALSKRVETTAQAVR